jgi:hypothetical protein
MVLGECADCKPAPGDCGLCSEVTHNNFTPKGEPAPPKDKYVTAYEARIMAEGLLLKGGNE